LFLVEFRDTAVSTNLTHMKQTLSWHHGVTLTICRVTYRRNQIAIRHTLEPCYRSQYNYPFKRQHSVCHGYHSVRSFTGYVCIRRQSTFIFIIIIIIIIIYSFSFIKTRTIKCISQSSGVQIGAYIIQHM